MNRQVPANVRRHLAHILLLALFLIGAFAGCRNESKSGPEGTTTRSLGEDTPPTATPGPTLVEPLRELPTIRPFVVPTLPVGAERLHFETVDYGGLYARNLFHSESENRLISAATDAEQETLQEDATGKPGQPDPAWDRIDMSRDIVIAIVMFAPTMYYGLADIPVEVVDASLMDGTVHMLVRVHKNPERVMHCLESGRSYHIITLLRSELPSEDEVHFIVDTTEGDRFAETTYSF